MASVQTQNCLVPLSDVAMAKVIEQQTSAGNRVLVVANAFTALLASSVNGGAWTAECRGDFGLKSGESAKAAAARGQLFWQSVAGSPINVDLQQNACSAASSRHVKLWLDAAEKLTRPVGRGDMPKREDLDYLGYLAGWRCQFAGCGKDLKRESLSGTAGVFSYFAHIIASSPIGPRGDKLLSGQRTADVENVLLLCDECHRRIDRVDPERFTVDVLRTMRQESINEVRRLLDSLRYQDAIPVVVMGNISAQAPRFVQRDAEEAMWTRKLRMAVTGPEHYFYNGGHLHNPHAPHYWGSLFAALADDIPVLRKRLNGTLRGDGTKVPLAVFPLHGTSVLVLAGRIVGEGSPVTLFQYNRDRPAHLPGGKWAFDDDAPRPLPDKYRVIPHQNHRGDEACLLVSMTYKIDPARLPSELYASGGFTMGALEVTATDEAALRAGILEHPDDIDYFALKLEEALRTLQDQWQVKRVHLIVGAPASACFRIGQKLQARNHAQVICYESAPGNPAFLPTISISNTAVEELQSHESISLA